ncbi:MAG: hypothetical protein ACI4EQ_07630 [Lachnospiraceae bacterium]
MNYSDVGQNSGNAPAKTPGHFIEDESPEVKAYGSAALVVDK